MKYLGIDKLSGTQVCDYGNKTPEVANGEYFIRPKDNFPPIMIITFSVFFRVYSDIEKKQKDIYFKMWLIQDSVKNINL